MPRTLWSVAFAGLVCLPGAGFPTVDAAPAEASPAIRRAVFFIDGLG